MKTFINYSWWYDLEEQALEIIISWLFKRSLKRGIQEVLMCGKYEYAGEKSVIMSNKWFLRCSKIATNSILLNLKHVLY